MYVLALIGWRDEKKSGSVPEGVLSPASSFLTLESKGAAICYPSEIIY